MDPVAVNRLEFSSLPAAGITFTGQMDDKTITLQGGPPPVYRVVDGQGKEQKGEITPGATIIWQASEEERLELHLSPQGRVLLLGFKPAATSNRSSAFATTGEKGQPANPFGPGFPFNNKKWPF